MLLKLMFSMFRKQPMSEVLEVRGVLKNRCSFSTADLNQCYNILKQILFPSETLIMIRTRDSAGYMRYIGKSVINWCKNTRGS